MAVQEKIWTRLKRDVHLLRVSQRQKRSVADRLKRLRREFLPMDEKVDGRYLEEARDRYDLEQRMRELDRPRTPARGPFEPFRHR